jgi:hypothetical protein
MTFFCSLQGRDDYDCAVSRSSENCGGGKATVTVDAEGDENEMPRIICTSLGHSRGQALAAATDVSDFGL